MALGFSLRLSCRPVRCGGIAGSVKIWAGIPLFALSSCIKIAELEVEEITFGLLLADASHEVPAGFRLLFP